MVGRYGELDPLCLDELGYIQIDPRGAGLPFQIVTEREERASMAERRCISAHVWRAPADLSDVTATSQRRRRMCARSLGAMLILAVTGAVSIAACQSSVSSPMHGSRSSHTAGTSLTTVQLPQMRVAFSDGRTATMRVTVAMLGHGSHLDTMAAVSTASAACRRWAVGPQWTEADTGVLDRDLTSALQFRFPGQIRWARIASVVMQ